MKMGFGGVLRKLLRAIAAGLMVVLFSATISPATAAPGTPAITSVVAGDHSGYVKWQVGSGTQYQELRVYNAPTNGTLIWSLRLDQTETQWLAGPNESMNNGSGLYAEVAAFDLAGNVTTSSRHYFSPTPTPAASTANTSIWELQAFDASTQVYLNPTSNPAGTEYYVASFKSASSYNADRVVRLTSSEINGALEPSYDFRNMLNNIDIWYFSVAVVNENGPGAWSPRSGPGVYVYTYPADYRNPPPAMVTAVGGSLEATINWQTPSSISKAISGYMISYTQDNGESWQTQSVSGTATSATIPVYSGQTRFRVSALASDQYGSQFNGAWSSASNLVAVAKGIQTVTWPQSVVSSGDPAASIGIQTVATSTGSGEITYRIQDPGSAVCSINLSSLTIEATQVGTCTVAAVAGESLQELEGRAIVTFTFGTPANNSGETGNGGGGGGGGGALPAPVASLLTHKSAPAIKGEVVSGRPLTVVTGSWNSVKPVTETYRWFSCSKPLAAKASVVSDSQCLAISGETQSFYTVEDADLKKFLVLEVSATDGSANGTYSTSSIYTKGLKFLAIKTKPKVSGTYKVGKSLSASKPAWNGSVKPKTVTYKWLRCSAKVSASENAAAPGCKAISKATKSSYKLTSADKGKFVAVQVTAVSGKVKNSYSTSATSAVK